MLRALEPWCDNRKVKESNLSVNSGEYPAHLRHFAPRMNFARLCGSDVKIKTEGRKGITSLGIHDSKRVAS
jgi:hypothetical protein